MSNLTATPDVPRGYTLVICEKPDAARRVAEAIAEGPVRYNGDSFSLRSRGTEVVVCAAQGHLYGVSDPLDERTVYPVFDSEWFQSDEVVTGSGLGRKISAIRKLAENASSFVNACDYDAEGEVIGFNILKYACSGKEGEASRARFSTLTKDELLRSFGEARAEGGHGLATAGRSRHVADFVWGVNLSRILSRSATAGGRGYRTVSMGRVQGPTLGFVVEREKEIRSFVPKPYWTATGRFGRDGWSVAAECVSKIGSKKEADALMRECEGGDASVVSVDRRTERVAPPYPFNIGTLQREAYAQFGFTPSRTLQMAERLYLHAMISYPRTDSQSLPKSIDYRKILRGVGREKEYSAFASELVSGRLEPVRGPKDDPAHPAVYPTGEPKRRMDPAEERLYDLIVRRFLAAFGDPARVELSSMRLDVGRHRFDLAGRRLVTAGWTRYYGRYYKATESELPPLSVGDVLTVVRVDVSERFEARPPRYSEAGLLEKMEREGIGTKATRAETISTLVKRGYVVGQNLTATDLGLSVAEVMERHAASIMSPELTREVERLLEGIEAGEVSEKEFLREVIRRITGQLIALDAERAGVGRELSVSAPGRDELGACPVCKTGRLRVVRSVKTRKRFVGCTNYRSGCRASAPLPQRGSLTPSAKPCAKCGWPVVSVWTGRRYPWRLCVNPSCPSKERKKDVL